MALRKIYTNASDEELAALYSLNLLVSSDIEEVAVKWMLDEKGSGEVAFLASRTHPSLNLIRSEVEKAFSEIKIEIPCKKTALKKILKFHLKQILVCQDDYMAHLNELVELDKSYAGRIVLFERPDCDENFKKYALKYLNSKSTKFAGQEFGIEKLYGLYYWEDDFNRWTRKLEKKRRIKVIEETNLVLDRFYKD